VIVSKFSEGVFYATLICKSGETELEIDSRTSDAIALAIRFQCPIYTYENIMAAAGILMDEESEKAAPDLPGDDVKIEEKESYPENTTGELREKLRLAVENEEYEKASKIRDELNKRK
jgi:bifunctional DNase/RNase